MSDTLSPINRYFHAGARHGDDACAIAISQTSIGALVQVQAWPDSQTRVSDAVTGVTGLAPAAIGHSTAQGAAILMTLAPGRFLLMGEDGDIVQRLQAAVPAAMGAVTDLGHARLALHIAGAPVVSILNKHVAIDLDDSVFPVGRVAQSQIHHMDVTLLRRAADGFLILGFRGFGLSLFESLCDASLEFGYRLE